MLEFRGLAVFNKNDGNKITMSESFVCKTRATITSTDVQFENLSAEQPVCSLLTIVHFVLVGRDVYAAAQNGSADLSKKIGFVDEVGNIFTEQNVEGDANSLLVSLSRASGFVLLKIETKVNKRFEDSMPITIFDISGDAELN